MWYSVALLALASMGQTREISRQDMLVFPDMEIVEQNLKFITRLQSISRMRRDAAQNYEDFTQWSWIVDDVDNLYRIWELLRQCLECGGGAWDEGSYYPFWAFSRLRGELGDAHYFMGYMPSPVPDSWPKGD